MLDRKAEQFDVTPSRLVADGGYGSAEMDKRVIEPHVKLIDKAERRNGTFSREPTSPSIGVGPQKASALANIAERNSPGLAYFGHCSYQYNRTRQVGLARKTSQPSAFGL
jgi:hypothetical protein